MIPYDNTAPDANHDNSLNVTNLNHKCKNLTIVLKYDKTSSNTSLTSIKSLYPRFAVEFYGKFSNEEKQVEADRQHKKLLDSILDKKVPKTTVQVGASIEFLTRDLHSTTKTIEVMPQPPNKSTIIAAPKSQEKTAESTGEEQIETSVSQAPETNTQID